VITPRVDDFADDLQPIAAEIGVDVAWALCRAFGATRLYIPKTWHAGLDLNEIGVEAAQALCERFGPERIDVPRVPFTAAALHRFAVAARKEGYSNSRIGRALGLSYRTIARLAAGVPVLTPRGRRVNDERQIDLIDWLGGSKTGD